MLLLQLCLFAVFREISESGGFSTALILWSDLQIFTSVMSVQWCLQGDLTCVFLVRAVVEHLFTQVQVTIYLFL